MTLDEMKQKHPSIYKEYEKAAKEQEAINKELMPLRQKRDVMLAKDSFSQEAERELASRIKELQTKKAPIDMRVSGLVKAMGGG